LHYVPCEFRFDLSTGNGSSDLGIHGLRSRSRYQALITLSNIIVSFYRMFPMPLRSSCKVFAGSGTQRCFVMEEFCLLEYNVTESSEGPVTSRRNLSLPSSGLSCYPSKKVSRFIINRVILNPCPHSLSLALNLICLRIFWHMYRYMVKAN
jgi:hypothetical protein